MLLLADKAYYDYDYSRPDKKWRVKRNAPSNDEELKQLLNHFGIREVSPKKRMSAEELQTEVIREDKQQESKQ